MYIKIVLFYYYFGEHFGEREQKRNEIIVYPYFKSHMVTFNITSFG